MPPISSSSAYTLSSAQRGYTKGESVIFTKKVLAPLGIAIASAVGMYALYKWNQNKKEHAEADEMFSSRANTDTFAKAPVGTQQKASTSAPASGATLDAEAQRKKALAELLDIIGGVATTEKRAESKQLAKKEKEDVDEEAYIHRFFEFVPMPEGFSDARSYCLAAVEATLAMLEGKKPKKDKKGKDEDSEFEDEMSNPDPILQVATQIEVDLRHRLAYFGQEFGFTFFKDNEMASELCATYAGPIPKPSHTPSGPLTKKVLLEAVKEYLEVCIEIDRTKPIVVDLAIQDTNGGRDKGMWKAAELKDGGAIATKGSSKVKKSKYVDEFESENDNEWEDEVAKPAAKGNKEAALGRMLGNRESRFFGDALSKADGLIEEKHDKIMRSAEKARNMMAKYSDGHHEGDDEDADEEEDDLENDLAFIGEPLHDVNRRAFEAALIRAVLAQISGHEDPLTKPHLPILDRVAALYREPSEDDDEDDYFDYDEDGPYGDDDYDNPMAHMRRFMGGRHMDGDDEDLDDDFDDFDDLEGPDGYRQQLDHMMMMRHQAMKKKAANGAAASRAHVNAILGEEDAADRKAMFLDDDDDYIDEDEHFDFADDPSREAFIRDMLAREAAEYEAMVKGSKKQSKTKGSAKSKTTNAEAEDEDDEWVDY